MKRNYFFALFAIILFASPFVSVGQEKSAGVTTNSSNYTIVSYPQDITIQQLFPSSHYVKGFNAETQAFVNITDNSYILKRGFAVFAKKLSGTYSFTSYPNDAATDLSVAYDTIFPSFQYSNWALIGNPYGRTWSVDKSDFTVFASQWSFDRASYYVRVAGSWVAQTFDDNAASIQPCSGFMAHVQTNGAVWWMDGSINAYTASKSNVSIDNYLTIKTTSGDFGHELKFCFYDNLMGQVISDGVDYFDAELYQSNDLLVPEVYTSIDNAKYSINFSRNITGSVFYPVSINSNSGNITLNIDFGSAFDESNNVFLEDLLTHQMIDLRTTPSYTFNYDAAMPNRFKLHVAGQASGISNLGNNSLSAIVRGNEIQINNTSNETGIITICNVLGQIMVSKELTKGMNSFTLPAACYVVNLKTQTQNTSTKIAIVK